ncbi:unnamed protein product [Caenorhabditis bovis]|uniref:CX domain-containing protein n=1 Tax=Caenorhabditis bovis TaxID=2654633 RepID=A0A8S1EAU9_9PELO|nr:unnamed protein product [Caenorhabditis bovis]
MSLIAVGVDARFHDDEIALLQWIQNPELRDPIQYHSSKPIGLNSSNRLNIQISTNSNLSYTLDFAQSAIFDYSPHQLEVVNGAAVIRNLSLPFLYNGIEYYFGTNRDLSNYSSIPHSLVCEYPLPRHAPSLYGKFVASISREKISRIIFGCDNSKYMYCCGLRCCEDISVTEVLKIAVYFFGVFGFLLIVIHQISTCDDNARRRKKFEEFLDDVL